MSGLDSACERVTDLMACLYGEASAAEERSFRQHAATCAQCSEDLKSFGQLRTAIGDWRQESVSGFSATNVNVFPAERKRSAGVAIREFLNWSPLWMKAALAFGSVLFSLMAVLLVARMNSSPREVVRTTVVPDQQSQAKVQELQQKVSELTAALAEKRAWSALASQSEKKALPKQSQSTASATVARGRRGPLSKQERQELAADLRLSDEEDSDLDLLSDRLSRPEEK